MDMHYGPEVRQNLLGAPAAGVLFDKIPGFTADELDVIEGHGAAANPFVAVAEVDMVEFGHGCNSQCSPESGLVAAGPGGLLE